MSTETKAKFTDAQQVFVATVESGYVDEHPRTGKTIWIPPVLRTARGIIRDFDLDCDGSEYRVELIPYAERETWCREDQLFATKEEAEAAFENGDLT